jgi:hypothetical protein
MIEKATRDGFRTQFQFSLGSISPPWDFPSCSISVQLCLSYSSSKYLLNSHSFMTDLLFLTTLN